MPRNTRRQHYIPTANHIIVDNRLYPSSQRVLLALLAHKGRKNRVRITQSRISDISHCSRSTVYSAVRQLQALGYLRLEKKHRFSAYLGRVVRSTTVYQLCNIGLDDGYTLVPYAILGAEINHSAFAMLLHGYRLSGRKGRSYASLRRMAKECDLAKSTIVRAVKQLHSQEYMFRLHCIKKNGSFSCNSYYPTAMVWGQNAAERRQAPAQKIFADGGGLIFGQPLVIKEDNEGFIKREAKYGVAQFGSLHKIFREAAQIPPLAFDGTGVKVFVTEEQFW